MDIMREVVGDIEDLDHKVFIVKAGEDLADEIWDLMEADGYKFACAPRADKTTRQRKIYFVRRSAPAPRM
jgi:hypothetical protein